MSYRIELPSGAWVTAERVTQVIRRGMPSPFLERWKLREAVRFALLNPTLGASDEDVKSVLAAWQSDSARHSQRGTDVHRLIARWLGDPIVDLDVPPERAGYFAAFMDWIGKHRTLPTDWLIEQTLLDGSCTVGGTADLIAGDVLIDWKTSEKHDTSPPYADHIAQVGAYSSMKHLVDDKRVSGLMPTIRRAMIVRLCADGTSHTTTLEGADLSQAQALWRHVREVAKRVRGVPE